MTETCNTCGSKLLRDEKWDAYCCPKCDIWTEPGCGDPNCYFNCNARPEKPSLSDGEKS